MRGLFFLILSGVLLAPAVKAEEPWYVQFEQGRARANAACQRGEYEACAKGLRSLLPLVDGRADIQCVLAAALARLGRQQEAVRSFGLCAGSQLDISALLSAPSLQVLRALPGIKGIEQAAAARAAGPQSHEVRLRLNEPDLITEDILFDATNGSFLVSSVRKRKVVRIGRDNTISDFLSSKLTPAWGFFALALDQRRGALWVTTTALAHSPPYETGDDGRSAVLRFDVQSRTLRDRYELVDGSPHAFGDMTLGPDGTAYISDGRGGGVYAAHPGRSDLEVIVPPGHLHSPQTPALSSEASVLLIPDYTRGIARVRLASRELEWVSHPPELALFGLDGFYWGGRTLVGVQNGTAPERILVMGLDRACRRITSWRVALAHVPDLGDPTHGLIKGRDFYFLANSGWDRFDDDGHPVESKQARPAEIWRMPLPADVQRAASCSPAHAAAGNSPASTGPAARGTAEVG